MTKAKETAASKVKSTKPTRRVVKQKVVKAPTVKRQRIKLNPAKRADGKTDYTASTTLVFPTDTSGLLTNLRKEFRTIASKIGTDAEKRALLKETLQICMKHVDARVKYNEGAGVLRSRSERINARKAEEQAILDDLAADATLAQGIKDKKARAIAAKKAKSAALDGDTAASQPKRRST